MLKNFVTKSKNRNTFPSGMSCDEAFAIEQTTPFVALANSIHDYVVNQKYEA